MELVRGAVRSTVIAAAVTAACVVSLPRAEEQRMRTMATYAQEKIEAEGLTISYYMARPQGEPGDTWPGVVLAHDRMGVDKEFTGIADRLAAQGFIVMAPDLYRGKIALDADKGREMSVLADEKEAAAILSAMAGYLKFLPEVGNHRVGLVGFGFGGRIALAGGGASTDLSAVVTISAPPRTDLDALRAIGVPMLAIYGGQDQTISLKEMEAFRAALVEAKRDATVRIHPGAGHDFMMGPIEGHRAEAVGSAWEYMVNFLKERL